MAMTLIKRKAAGIRLMLCLILILLVAAGCLCTGYGDGAVQELNSSGNVNTPLSADPFRYNERYSAVMYNNRNGLPTSEANAIAQTSDGFIWIGSYGGLVRYDGNTFERFDPTAGIANVRSLYVDSRDRLWIGTNDSGIFLLEKEEVRKWNKKDGLLSVSIRAIAQEENGTIYIGCVPGIAMIDTSLNLTLLDDERVAEQTIRDLRRGSDGVIYGLTEDGDLFSIQQGKIVTFLSHEECRVKNILAILPDPTRPGDLYLGTGDSVIYNGNLERNFSSMGMRDISPLHAVERFENINKQVWICAANGIGRVDSEGFHSLTNVPLTSSVGHVMTDYEGNLWFTSTRQGLMKIVPNQFSDIFEQSDLPEAVVNTTCMYGQQLFIGTDTGLMVTDRGTRVQHIPLTKAETASGEDLGATDLLEFLDSIRIRSIIRDSKGRLWISTWRKYGLLCYDKGELVSFNKEEGLLSSRVRVVYELDNGSLAVANTGGVCIIEDDRVVRSYGKDDGIDIGEILTVTEGYNHDLILGSDGGGIYIISQDGTRHIGTDEGLGSDIILRIKRSRNKEFYWVIAGNSLAFMTPDYQVTTIREFPYPNNFDLYENSKGEAWIISGDGIYEIPVDELLANGTIRPTFHGIANGLPYIATANSYSELTADGDLYISSSVGVIKVNIEKPFENISALKVALPYIDADGRRYYPNDDGNYLVPGSVHKLTIHPRVFNYLLINPQVSYHLEGFDMTETTVTTQEIVPVDYTNLPNGKYQFVMLIEDPAGNADQTVSFQIIKGREKSVGAAGNIIINTASLLFLLGILMYATMYRKRGTLDDRIFFAMIITNMILAAADELSGMLEGTTFTGAIALNTAVNMISFLACAAFPYLMLLYFEYRMDQDDARFKRKQLLYSIPCILLVLLQIINLKTGWVFYISSDNIYNFGKLSDIVFIPVAFYYLMSLDRVRRLDRRLMFPAILLIAARIGLGIWIRDIFSTGFIHTGMLMGMHISDMHRPLNKEAL